MNAQQYNQQIDSYLGSIPAEFKQISEERQNVLKDLGSYLIDQQEADKESRLVFICTHNSRRSQFSQFWAFIAAGEYGLDNISTYSGGTESTAFNHRAVKAIERTGFSTEIDDAGSENPKYRFNTGGNFSSQVMFSKKYDHPSNPQDEFCAVMVCSDADEACPFIPGASERISLPFNDPKEYDGTPQEAAKYDERCRQVAREMFYLMSYVAQGD